MIHVYGTSHVSKESLDLIDEAFEKHQPDVVALELDYLRLNSLLNEEETTQDVPLFMKLLKKTQDRIGSKTGVMPGTEMKYAYHKAVENESDVALIDQDIGTTVQKLMGISRKEKVKAGISLIGGMILPGRFDVSKIPEDDMITNMMEKMRRSFPQLTNILVDERNEHMRRALDKLQEEDPEAEIVAFVGAAHKEEVEKPWNP